MIEDFNRADFEFAGTLPVYKMVTTEMIRLSKLEKQTKQKYEQDKTNNLYNY